MNKKRILEEFFELVRIPCETKNERQIVDLMQKRLKELGAVEIVEDHAGEKIGGNAGNTFAYFEGDLKNIPTIMLNAHVDCVKPCINIEPIIENGIIRSKGDTILGGDDKTGVVAILETLRVLKEENIPHGDIQVVFTVAEEGGVYGACNMEPQYLKAKFGYAIDGPGHPGKVILSAPGQVKIFATFRGKNAHAGISPEEGINAIVIAGKALAQIKDGRIDEETTCNVGIISGGLATNIVPDTCLVTSEVRSRSLEKLESLLSEIIETYKNVAKENGGSVEISTDKVYDPFVLKDSDEVVALAIAAANSIGLNAVSEDGGGGSDANFINTYGVPTPAMGMGCFKAHTHNEYMPEEDLYNTVAWVVGIVKEVVKKYNK